MLHDTGQLLTAHQAHRLAKITLVPSVAMYSIPGPVSVWLRSGLRRSNFRGPPSPMYQDLEPQRRARDFHTAHNAWRPRFLAGWNRSSSPHRGGGQVLGRRSCGRCRRSWRDDTGVAFHTSSARSVVGNLLSRHPVSIAQALRPDFLQDGRSNLFYRLGCGRKPADAATPHHGFRLGNLHAAIVE